MLKRNLWKIILSVAIAGWALSELFPIKDIPFQTYVRDHATAKQADFDKLLGEAQARVNDHKAQSVFVALKDIGDERMLDLSQYFPDINLESSLKNIHTRNDILLNELLHRSKGKIQLGLDLRGGVAVTLEVDPAVVARDPSDLKEKLAKAVDIISARVNSFGVTEPVIRPVGQDQIEVELPGVNTKDNPEIVNDVKAPAKLEFREVHPTLQPDPSKPYELPPPGYEKLSLVDEEGSETMPPEYYIKRIPDATGDIISKAYTAPDEYGNPEILMKLTDAGRKSFDAMTKKIADEGQRIGRVCSLAIVLDGKLYSVATVRQEIDSPSASIEGHFSDREAMTLANVLNNPLDLPLIVREQDEVGPTLAQDAISSGMRASIIGISLVAAFMITFYATGGLVAVGTLAVNLMVILGTMASFGATMTEPGLAGIVLTVGMAVDANILIFERMREEMAAGKSLSASNQGGYRKALMTIVDAHIVQLIICLIMISLGTGPIKGFGVTLAIGVLSTMFSVLITAHLVMELIIDSGLVKKIHFRHLLKHINWDFVKFGRPAFIGSWTLVLIGLSVVIFKGNRIYDIDFTGGDVVNLQYQHQMDLSKVRAVADAAKVGQIEPTYVTSIGGTGGALLKIETPAGKSETLVQALENADPSAGLVEVSRSFVGPSIGREIELNALLAVGVSMLTILLYIALRFEFGFGVGAMVSTLHDILMTIGFFVLTGHQFSAPMVAAILCIAGYSINETVVVFDRIREELKVNPTGSLREVVNTGISKVFARTIMTATTTFLAAFSLFIFGRGVLQDIAFTFCWGILTSTFSAIFVAAQVFYWWHKGDRKHVESHADVAPKYEWTGASRASR